jgi:hypothetical protein
VPAAGDSTGAAVGTPWQSKLGTVLGGGRGLDNGLLSALMLRLVEREVATTEGSPRRPTVADG